MKALITGLFVLGSIITYGQWDVIHASGNNGGHRDLYFLNNDTGFVIGSNGDGSYILRTEDGGTDWDSLWYDDHQFKTIYFPSADTGYIACFYFNTVAVLRTINGGDSWQLIADSLENAVSVPYAISFFNNDTGIITLQNWAAKTIDAGETWTELTDYPYGGTNDGDINGNTYIGIGSAIIAWTFDYGENFEEGMLGYFDGTNLYGSHLFVKAKNEKFLASALGQNGDELGLPSFSFGILTIGNVLTQEFDVRYFPYLSRTYGVSWPSENIMYAVCRPIYNEGANERFFMKSIDGGDTWYRQETIEPYYYGTQSLFCPSESVCYAVGGNNAYIYKTTNGGGPLLDEVEQIVLSVKEIDDDLNFSIAPNPTSGEVLVNSEKEKIKEVKVFDLQGKELLQSYPNDFNAHIDLSKFESGIYLIQIMAGDKIRTGKIVRE